MPDIKEKLVELLDKQKGYTLPIWTAPQTIEIMVDALIANGVTIQQWISVEERLPESGVVLVCGSRGGIYTAEIRRANGYTWFHKLNSKSHYCEPTHWMPLPEPPKGE